MKPVLYIDKHLRPTLSEQLTDIVEKLVLNMFWIIKVGIPHKNKINSSIIYYTYIYILCRFISTTYIKQCTNGYLVNQHIFFLILYCFIVHKYRNIE